MVRPGFTASSDSSASQVKVQHAEAVIDNLVRGRSVAREQMTEARETCVNLLWGGNTTAEGTARNGLGVLYTHMVDPGERAELIGELVAAGPRARPILDRILQLAQPEGLLANEVEALRGSLHLAPRERLDMVAKWLAEEGSRTATPMASESAQNRLFPVVQPQISPQANESHAQRSEFSAGAAPGPSQKLIDTTLSEEERLNAVLELGAAAIPTLCDLLRGPDPHEQEFAATALNHLGQTQSTARHVYQAARRLESDPAVRLTAESIRRNLEATRTGATQNSHTREQAKNAAVPDGWLRRALADVDSPNLLKAAVGREVLAIPLAVRRLAELRVGASMEQNPR